MFSIQLINNGTFKNFYLGAAESYGLSCWGDLHSENRLVHKPIISDVVLSYNVTISTRIILKSCVCSMIFSYREFCEETLLIKLF